MSGFSLTNVVDTKQYSFRGRIFQQFFQRVPSVDWMYSKFEREWDSTAATQFANNNWIIPVVAVTLYASMVYFGPKIMAKRDAFVMKGPMALWNLFLSVFSTIGMIRTVPHMLLNIRELEFKSTICGPSDQDWGSGATGFWVMLFIYSKLPELVDTVFLVLKKKPVEFLHWYHHITVLLYCWHAYATEAATGLYFVAMNYSVHATMYGYFFLMTLGLVPKWFPSWTITIAQIAQMFGGTFVCLSTWYYMIYQGDSTCSNKTSNLIYAGLMYSSYLYLFVDFAVRKFILGEKGSDKKKSKKTDDSGATSNGLANHKDEVAPTITPSKDDTASTLHKRAIKSSDK